jgi:hypothetical protein
MGVLFTMVIRSSIKLHFKLRRSLSDAPNHYTFDPCSINFAMCHHDSHSEIPWSQTLVYNLDINFQL